jgi:RNA polymerase sigma-70 factor, ECF subfamily
MTARSPAPATSPGNEDERLVIEAAKMDPRRFAELYEQNFDRVYAFVARRAGHRGEAEDVTAEVFHRALANLRRFEWRGAPFAAWLLQIASNALADRWQRAARERGEPSRETGNPRIHAEAERRALLAELVGRLPDDQQRVIRERFVEQKSIREIARELSRTEGAVKQLQFRALESLRAHMRDVNE